MTTNVEFGLDVTTGRAVLGCPLDCPNPERNRYLIYVAHRHGVPVCTTITDTVTAALSPLARLGVPSDVAGVVAFLVSDDAGWVTGQLLDATGGALL